MYERRLRYEVFGTQSERLSLDILHVTEGQRFIETDTGKEYIKYEDTWHTAAGGTGGMEIHGNEYHNPDFEPAGGTNIDEIDGGGPMTAAGDEVDGGTP